MLRSISRLTQITSRIRAGRNRLAPDKLEAFLRVVCLEPGRDGDTTSPGSPIGNFFLQKRPAAGRDRRDGETGFAESGDGFCCVQPCKRSFAPRWLSLRYGNPDSAVAAIPRTLLGPSRLLGQEPSKATRFSFLASRTRHFTTPTKWYALSRRRTPTAKST